MRLKDLLHNQGYTIAGARKKLREDARRSAVVTESDQQKPAVAKRKRASKAAAAQPDIAPEPVAEPSEEVDPNQMMLPLVSGFDSRLLDEIRQDLQALRDSLSRAPSSYNFV